LHEVGISKSPRDRSNDVAQTPKEQQAGEAISS
jgi:hypothetical protein